MFARGVDVIAKPSKTLEVADAIRERALPILRKQSGFVDEIVLVSDTEVDHVLTLSFWTQKKTPNVITETSTRHSTGC